MSWFSNAIRAGGNTGVGHTHNHDSGKGDKSGKSGFGKCTRLKQCSDVPLTTSSKKAPFIPGFGPHQKTSASLASYTSAGNHDDQ